MTLGGTHSRAAFLYAKSPAHGVREIRRETIVSRYIRYRSRQDHTGLDPLIRACEQGRERYFLLQEQAPKSFLLPLFSSLGSASFYSTPACMGCQDAKVHNSIDIDDWQNI
jgi:hypothetical protein